ADADIILSCLFDDQSVIDVSMGDNGIINQMKQSAVYVGLSTILPETATKLGDYAKQKQKNYISAAVLGVPKVATQGELTTFCAGDKNCVELIRPVLQTFSKSVINLGVEAKASMIMKICMNYSLVTTLELISELYAFAEKSGLDTNMVQQGLHEIFGHSAFKLYVDKIQARNFDEVNFDMQTGHKDVAIFQKAFANVGVTPRLGDLLKGRIISALANDMQNKDWSAVYEIVRKEAGLD
ncbi:MAG: NAD(P)-binding domain-containing protein, partial [Pseudomonadota bacterium]